MYQQSHGDIKGDVTPTSLQYQNVHCDWAVPEKKHLGVEDILFLKQPLKLPGFLLYPWKQNKTSPLEIPQYCFTTHGHYKANNNVNTTSKEIIFSYLAVSETSRKS